MPSSSVTEAALLRRWTTDRFGGAHLAWSVRVVRPGRQEGGFTRMKSPQKQLPLFSARSESALWLRLPEPRRDDIVDRYARLIARAAKPALLQHPVGTKEER